jgi:hypothetical protein
MDQTEKEQRTVIYKCQLFQFAMDGSVSGIPFLHKVFYNHDVRLHYARHVTINTLV